MELAETVVYLKNRSPSRDDTLRDVVRKQTRCRTSQNYRINCICSRFKGKAHETRHPLAQGDHDRLWRQHQPVQGMGSYEERRRHFKGCSIYQGKTNRTDPSSLCRRTQDYSRLDHGSTQTFRNRRAPTTASIASAIRASGSQRTGRTRGGRPSDFIARIGENNRAARISNQRRSNRQIKKHHDAKNIGTIKQGHIYLQEIHRRRLRQEIRSYSHGKDCTEHRSKRLGRTGDSSRSHQSSHTWEAVGESDTGRSQLAHQESYMGSRSTPPRSPNRHQQIGIQAQKGRTRTNRQVEGKIGRQRIQSDLRHRLPRHLRTSRQTRINQNTSCNRGNSRIGDSSDGCCDGILGRRTRRGNLHGATGRIQGWNEGGRPRVQTQEKSLRPQASSKGLESENSGFPQVNRFRPIVLRSLRIHQQDDRNHHRNVGGRSHYFWKGYGQHQRSQSTAQRRVRDEGPRRAQILSRHTSPSGQGTKDHPHQPVRLQSNDSRTVRHAEQQAGKHSSFQQRSTHQGDGDRSSCRPKGIPKYGRKPHVRNARYQTGSCAMHPTNLSVFADPNEDPRKSSKACASISQRNN